LPPPNHRKDTVKSGDLTLLASQVKLASECYKLGQRVYKEICRRESTPKPKADVWEIFAGKAEISKAALRRNLLVMQPIDSIFGSTVEEHRTKEIYDCLRRGGGIKFVVCAFSCSLWSILNYNCNYAHRRDELSALQEKVLVTVFLL
jgi:hypothetical protein